MSEKIITEYTLQTGGAIKGLNDLITRIQVLENSLEGVAKNDPLGKIPQSTTKAKSGFDALGNSINQVTREFPAFAFSAQTGFLAVSNNIPILIDSINALKVANAQLAAEGKATIPVFTQIISSLFSWQTALSLLISFSVLYGKELGNFVISLFKGKDAIDKAKISLDALNEAYKSKSLATNIENLVKLKTDLNLASQGYLNKKAVLFAYNEEFGKTLGIAKNVNEAEQNLIANTPKLITALIQ